MEGMSLLGVLDLMVGMDYGIMVDMFGMDGMVGLIGDGTCSSEFGFIFMLKD